MIRKSVSVEMEIEEIKGAVAALAKRATNCNGEVRSVEFTINCSGDGADPELITATVEIEEFSEALAAEGTGIDGDD